MYEVFKIDSCCDAVSLWIAVVCVREREGEREFAVCSWGTGDFWYEVFRSSDSFACVQVRECVHMCFDPTYHFH